MATITTTMLNIVKRAHSTSSRVATTLKTRGRLKRDWKCAGQMEFVLCRFIAADTFVSRYTNAHTHTHTLQSNTLPLLLPTSALKLTKSSCALKSRFVVLAFASLLAFFKAQIFLFNASSGYALKCCYKVRPATYAACCIALLACWLSCVAARW